MTPLQHLFRHKLIAIIRGDFPLETLAEIGETLFNAGIRTLEITLNSANALEAIEMLAESHGNRLLIGAGTVLTREHAVEAVQAGAQFILSPNTDQEVIETTKFHQTVSIPGAFTATEILRAHDYGADLVKVFPARLGAAYISDIRGPYPHIPLLPTGGVNLDNIPEFLKAGAKGIGVGSSLIPRDFVLSPESLQQLEDRARSYVSLVSNF